HHTVIGAIGRGLHNHAAIDAERLVHAQRRFPGRRRHLIGRAWADRIFLQRTEHVKLAVDGVARRQLRRTARIGIEREIGRHADLPFQSMTAVKSHCTSAPPSMSACCEWRAGRECSSGNIFSHSTFSGPRCERSLSHTVILMMSSVVPPAASTVAFICANMLAHCASMLSGILPSWSRPRMTPLITRLPMRQAFGIGLACLKPPIWMLLRRPVLLMTPFLL